MKKEEISINVVVKNEERVDLLYEQIVKDYPHSTIFKDCGAFLMKIEEGTIVYTLKVFGGIGRSQSMRLGRCHYLFLDEDLEIFTCQAIAIPLLNLRDSRPLQFLRF